MKYLLSIIVPVYNVEEYLSKCIESLIAGCGKYWDKTEIVLVDDGSPDKCPEICDAYTQKYSNIKTIHKQNGGVSSARNLGIEKSSGEYITFCDSDDYVTNEFEKVFEYIDLHPNVDVFSVGLIKDGEFISKFKDKEYNPQNYNDILEIVKRDVTISCCAKIVKRKFVVDNDILFPTGIKSEDLVWSCNLLFKSTKFMLVDLAYYNYVNRESSVTHSVTLKGIESQIKNYSQVKQMVAALQFNTRQKKSLLRYLMQGYVYVIYTSRFLHNQDYIRVNNLFKTNKDLLYKPKSIKLLIYYIYLKIFKY